MTQVKLFYMTYNNMQKNCKMLPNKINIWKIEWIHLCFFPTPYKIAPIVYAIPPANNKLNPAIPNNCGNKFIFTTIHHPITK